MWKWKVETKIRTICCRRWQDGWSNLLFIFQTGKMWNYLRSKSQGYFFHTMWNPYTQLFGWYQLCDPWMCNPAKLQLRNLSIKSISALTQQYRCQLSNPNNHHNLKLYKLVIPFFNLFIYKQREDHLWSLWS